MLIVEHESEKFEWNYDTLYGVGYFVRKCDGAVSYLETGSDCATVRRSLNRLRSKTSSHRYPKQAPSFASIFDSMASENEFHTE